MITERVAGVREGRADFDELELVHDGHMSLDETAHAHVRLWRAPDDTPVLHLIFSCPRATVEHARVIGERLQVPDDAHFFVSAMRYEDGFAAALDEALPGEVKVTLIERVPDPPEVRQVPWPAPAPAVAVQLTISEGDFERLTCEAQPFDGDFDDLEPTDWWNPGKTDREAIHGNWAAVYLVLERLGWSELVMAKAFLRGQGEPYEVCQDEAGNWWLLTDFKTASLRRQEEQARVRERLAVEAAEASGDELAKAFHMPAAEKQEKGASNG